MNLKFQFGPGLLCLALLFTGCASAGKRATLDPATQAMPIQARYLAYSKERLSLIKHTVFDGEGNTFNVRELGPYLKAKGDLEALEEIEGRYAHKLLRTLMALTLAGLSGYEINRLDNGVPKEFREDATYPYVFVGAMAVTGLLSIYMDMDEVHARSAIDFYNLKLLRRWGLIEWILP